MKKILALVMVALMTLCVFAGCGAKDTNTDAKPILVAEKESAGETVAKEDATLTADYDYTAVDTQAKALMEVAAGTADAAIIDYVMSIGSIGEGTDYENLEVTGEGYSPENYGIAFRKGSDVTAKVNEAIKALLDEGELKKIADTWFYYELHWA